MPQAKSPMLHSENRRVRRDISFCLSTLWKSRAYLKPCIMWRRHSCAFQKAGRITGRTACRKKKPNTVWSDVRRTGHHLHHLVVPQARGRIERLWGSFQDRLKNGLRIAGFRATEQGKLVLWGFLPRLNRRFAVRAREPDLA